VPLLTTRQVAERLHVIPQRVRQLIDAGELKATKYGRDLLVEEADLAAYLRRPRHRARPHRTIGEMLVDRNS